MEAVIGLAQRRGDPHAGEAMKYPIGMMVYVSNATCIGPGVKKIAAHAIYNREEGYLVLQDDGWFEMEDVKITAMPQEYHGHRYWWIRGEVITEDRCSQCGKHHGV